VTESSNTIHGKLTEENLEEFLDLFEGDEAVKEEIRTQFNINKLPTIEKKEIKVGDEYE
jgi:hypothetical protein